MSRGAPDHERKAALKRAKARDVRFHDLRHVFGTRMAAAGTDPVTLQEWMGHAHAATTEIYKHYMPDERRDRDLVAKAFAPVGSNLGTNLRETQSNPESLNGSGVRGGQ